MGKGSTRRPGDTRVFHSNYDRIFSGGGRNVAQDQDGSSEQADMVVGGSGVEGEHPSCGGVGDGSGVGRPRPRRQRRTRNPETLEA